MDDIDRKIDKALKTELDYSLPANFALKVVSNLNVIVDKSDKRFRWFLAIIYSSAFLVGIITVLSLSKAEDLKILSNYFPWIITMGITYFLVQYLDKKLIRPKIQS